MLWETGDFEHRLEKKGEMHSWGVLNEFAINCMQERRGVPFRSLPGEDLSSVTPSDVGRLGEVSCVFCKQGISH